MKKLSIIIFLFLNIYCFSSTTDKCIPVGLQCDYLVNPVGIDNPHPRLKWKLNDARRGAVQNAYEIIVSTDSAEIYDGNGNMWETGRIDDESLLVTYNGKELRPFTKYFWAVRVWDKDNNQGAFSEVSSFETGMMHMKNWKGSWITDTRDINLKPAP